MLKRADDTAEFVALADLGVLRIAGADTERFLQGQLSNDMQQLPSGRTQLAGYHNPQGRVIAVLQLVRAASDAVLAVLPRELAASVAQRLAKFTLRAKVKIEDLSAEWRVDGLIGKPNRRGPTRDSWCSWAPMPSARCTFTARMRASARAVSGVGGDSSPSSAASRRFMRRPPRSLSPRC
jgi:folate-binding Fe-S cluster repair protein YgfZ